MVADAWDPSKIPSTSVSRILRSPMPVIALGITPQLTTEWQQNRVSATAFRQQKQDLEPRWSLWLWNNSIHHSHLPEKSMLSLESRLNSTNDLGNNVLARAFLESKRSKFSWPNVRNDFLQPRAKKLGWLYSMNFGNWRRLNPTTELKIMPSSSLSGLKIIYMQLICQIEYAEGCGSLCELRISWI